MVLKIYFVKFCYSLISRLLLALRAETFYFFLVVFSLLIKSHAGTSFSAVL
jgi:hypothetical protein